MQVRCLVPPPSPFTVASIMACAVSYAARRSLRMSAVGDNTKTNGVVARILFVTIAFVIRRSSDMTLLLRDGARSWRDLFGNNRFARARAYSLVAPAFRPVSLPFGWFSSLCHNICSNAVGRVFVTAPFFAYYSYALKQRTICLPPPRLPCYYITRICAGSRQRGCMVNARWRC